MMVGYGMMDVNQPITNVMCQVLHKETDSCTRASLDFFKAAYLRALPVYLPVYMLPLVLFKSRQLLRRPIQILLPTVLNIARSSLFLSSYCSVCWAVACMSTKMGLVSHLKGALAGFFGGCTVAVEKK